MGRVAGVFALTGMSARRRPAWLGRPWAITLVSTFALITLAGALALALWGPVERAGAIASVLTATASTSAAICALTLTFAALARTDRQLVASSRNLTLSQYPLLVPVHESSTSSPTGVLARHPPTRDRFGLPSDGNRDRLFLAVANDSYTIGVENIGVGPALDIEGELRRSDGKLGAVEGPSMAAAKQRITLSVVLDLTAPASDFDTAAPLEEGAPYFLELRYVDVFGLPRSSTAVFQPTGLGRWIHLSRDALPI